ncbi:MAG: ABC transporter permease [Chloroflexi bacterium]|nr:ABC transporter permease [Chloroflexota bacterium]
MDSFPLRQKRSSSQNLSALQARLQPYLPTAKYILKRIGIYFLTVLGAVTLAFIFFHLMPGDPLSIVFSQLEKTNLGRVTGGAEVAEAYKRLLGLDQPLPVQYLLFLRNVLIGGFDLGPSFVAFPTSTRDVIFRQLPWTIGYFTSAMLIAWLIGTTIGALLGWLRRIGLTSVAVGIATLLNITPVYIIAIAAIIFFGYHLHWLPTGQPYDPGLTPNWGDIEFIKNVLRHAIMPIASVVLVWGASFSLGMRSLMISVLGEDYLSYAKAKGLTPFMILRDYAFRNALLPQVTALGIALGNTINGVLILEAIFVVPGVGGLFVRAMAIHDFNVMQGVVLLSTVAVLTLSLIVDLLLPFLDPRIRRSND